MQIKIKKLSDSATLPARGSDQAAGYDLYAADYADQMPATIYPHSTYMIHTGLAMEIPEGYFGAIYARSGLASKKGLRPANCVGVVDSDYRGEVMVALHNDSDTPQEVAVGERVAQIIIQKYEAVEYIEADELDDTSRGEGGFGSTGK